MIILPDRNVPRSKFILPVPKKEWMIPSLAQPKDQFGKENRTYFVIRAHAHDGKIVWRGVYEDRYDFDAVLWAIASDTLKYEKELWPLSTPNWDPWIGELPQYSFMAFENKTTGTGNQTFNKPTDWTDAGSKIECIGGGASGGAWGINSGTACGGGGGSYSRIADFNFSAASVTYNIGGGGTAVSTTTGVSGGVTGNNGNPTFFNATSDPGVGTDNSKCSAAGGSGGNFGNNATSNGGAGGATTASWGENKYAGGRGGNATGSTKISTGGGGAGGSNGAGNQGVDSGSQNTGTAGGAGGTGNTGVGTAGTSGSGSNNTGSAAGNGGNGTNLSNAAVGTGGGGGGINYQFNGTVVAGSGGNYGGGGGASTSLPAGQTGSVKATSGAGIGGLIIITWTPTTYKSGSMYLLFN